MTKEKKSIEEEIKALERRLAKKRNDLRKETVAEKAKVANEFYNSIFKVLGIDFKAIEEEVEAKLKVEVKRAEEKEMNDLSKNRSLENEKETEQKKESINAIRSRLMRIEIDKWVFFVEDLKDKAERYVKERQTI